MSATRGPGPKFPCARCGRPVTRTVRDDPRRITCPRCRYLIYDYPRVCAGTVVVKGSALLVLRRGHQPRRGYLDWPGGFMDAGETTEGAARRELREETGLTVGRMEPLGIWWDRYHLRGFGYFPTMNFYYLTRWRSGVPKAADDAADAEWMPIARVGRAGARLAWRHMAEVLREVRRRV
ncbi:MAG TPA: NUDIX domain-containing protein [Candidatus Eisenbacteria bacterium]|nr:NUDIX domain-containing protein [Candidatus Eisenbacteria bacterium]